MKRAILFICILAISLTVFCVPSFAIDDFDNQPLSIFDSSDLSDHILRWSYYFNGNKYLTLSCNKENVYAFFINGYTIENFYLVSDSNIGYAFWQSFTDSGLTNLWRSGSFTGWTLDDNTGLYYIHSYNTAATNVSNINLPLFQDLRSGLDAVYQLINSKHYNKNAYVDEFIANTLISMGVTFNSGSDALSVASDAWDWCIDEENASSDNRTYFDWDIDTFVSYCNAQSNNFSDWYNGYRVHFQVTNALGEYLRRNFEQGSGGSLLDGVPGTLSGSSVTWNRSYSPSAKGVSGGAYEFYAADTLTYVNGEYITSNGISLDQFAYTPPDVRQYLGSPLAPTLPMPDSPNGTGVITDENGDTVYNIDIEFPSLDWLGRALQAIADAIRNLIDNVSNLLSKIIDSLTKLFGDAFEGLSSFGEGIVEWIQLIVESIHDLMSDYFPSDLTAILFAFLCLNVGVGLIKFILRSH